MEDALDKSTGQIVHADRAVKHKRYICRWCRADCYLRSGEAKRPYFAHASGKADKNCEEYHHGNGTSSGAVHGDREAVRRALHLYFGLTGSENREWQLSLAIPEVSDGAGTVLVPQGLRGTISVPFYQLQRGGRRVPVRPQTEPYRLEVRETSDASFVQRVEKPIAGLNRVKPAVFRYSPAGGRRLAEDQPLFWGRAYFIVWAKDSGLDWFPINCTRHDLRPNGPWQAALLVLPIEEEYQTQAWAERTLGRTVLQPPVLITLVAPTEVDRLEDESSVVPYGTEVLVGVFGERGASAPTMIEVLYPGKTASEEVSLPGTLPAIVSLGQLPEGRTDLWVPWDLDAEISLVVSKSTGPIAQPQGVQILVQQGSGEKEEVPLYSERAVELLQGVRERKNSFERVTLPERVTGTLRLRSPAEFAWREVPLRYNEDMETAEGHAAFETRVGQEIKSYLSQPTLILQIDFGNYGTISLSPPRGETSEAKYFALSAWHYQQLEWLLSVPSSVDRISPTGEELRRFFQSIDLTSVAPSHRSLVARLRSRQIWSVIVEPHIRSLLGSLRLSSGWR